MLHIQVRLHRLELKRYKKYIMFFLNFQQWTILAWVKFRIFKEGHNNLTKQFWILLLKGRQSRIDFFKPTILQKKTNKRIQLYYYDTSGWLVLICFWKKLKAPKRHFEIKWPLVKSTERFCQIVVPFLENINCTFSIWNFCDYSHWCLKHWKHTGKRQYFHC